MKILALYDGTIQAKNIVHYALEKARKKGGEVLVLHVFESTLFVDYGAGPMAEQAARVEFERYRHDLEAIIHAPETGTIGARVVSAEGDPVEQAIALAGSEHADLVLATPRHKALVKRSPCPVSVMPGTILVPVDSSDSLKGDSETIIAEAKASGSRVLLLGLVPVHLYGSAELAELEAIRSKTAAALKKIGKALNDGGIETAEAMRDGYPDEEILKAAEAYSVSLIMLPSGGKTPSELAKAAAILIDEPERLKRPISVMSVSEA